MMIQQSLNVSPKPQDTIRLPYIHESFEDCARTTPDSVAVEYRDERVTYRELNRRANQLARYLRSLGVGPETLVGICAHRSVETIVGILGIIKAGGAYIPLDPNYPLPRLKFILDDAKAKHVVTQSALADLFSETSAQLIHLDRDWEKINLQPSDDLQNVVLPENLVYVIYTSGSTGKPKGVMITHSNLSHFVRNVSVALDIDASDRYLQSASISYALSVRQMMTPLSLGASLVLATAEQMQDPLALFELIKQREITLMDVVPSFWRACIQRLSVLPIDYRQSLFDNRLRRIVSVGEPLYSDVPLDWRRQFNHAARLVNIFGQTETTGVVATYPIPLDFRSDKPVIVPVGKAVPNTKIYILNSDLTQVGLGETGELCVSSPCLARGYLNHPDLTAEKFIANPFRDGLSARLYRTGDLALYREDGNIEFIGRRDSQVKIRGQRLELREVESVLRGMPEVADCVVVALGEKPEDKYLAAYVVARNQISADAVRLFMRERLPEYMTPARYVFLDSLPLTPSGKVDRLALPAPEISGESDSASGQVEANSESEKKLIKIWQDLLKIGSFGIHDNFFDLGGNSLLAVQLFGRIEREFGMRLPITTLYHAATVAKLADRIVHGEEPDRRWRPLVPIRTEGEKPPFFGIHGHEGGVLFWGSLLEFLPTDQPFYALQAQGIDGIQPPLRKIEEMASLYIREIRNVQPRGPYYLGGYSMGGEIALEIGQQLQRDGELVKLLVMFDTRFSKRRAKVASNNPQTRSTQDARTKPNVRRNWRTKIAGHLQRLKRLTFKQGADYVVHDLSYRTSRAVTFSLAKIFRMFGWRLPDALLLDYMRKSHTSALEAYSPRWYPGKITVFRANETLLTHPDDPTYGWQTLAGGGFEIFHFDADHNIFDAPYAPQVASQFLLCLEQAQNNP